MTVLAVANQKGGVGKTTTVVNLAAALQERGRRVLVVDNDPQASLALALGVVDAESLSPTLGDLLIDHAHARGEITAFDGIVRSPAGLELLPSNTRLSSAELVLVGAIGREMIMRDLLEPLRSEYDDIIIDCLPSLGLLAINALTAADAVLIPVQADYLALQGVAQMLETISAVKTKLNPNIYTLGALLTMMDVRTAHSRGVAALLREALHGQVRVFDVEVRVQVALKDSVQDGRTVLDYRDDSQAAAAYRQLADEVIAAYDQGPEWQPSAGSAWASREDELLEDVFGSDGPELLPEEPEADAAADEELAPAHVAMALTSFGTFLTGHEEWLGR